MKFLVDAHLPRRLCASLARHGHDVLHTLDLPAKNATKDQEIIRLSLDERRVVVSKDTDFFFSHLLLGRPWKLLLVRTGNISTRDLCAIVERNLSEIEAALQAHTLVEIDREAVRPVALPGKPTP
jgi:predicted nuclease of predicted toxin-antitoxin system